jgi:hypothetical protein
MRKEYTATRGKEQTIEADVSSVSYKFIVEGQWNSYRLGSALQREHYLYLINLHEGHSILI